MITYESRCIVSGSEVFYKSIINGYSAQIPQIIAWHLMILLLANNENSITRTLSNGK